MEDVRAVAVDQHAGRVMLVIRVAADVRAAVDDEDALAAVCRKTLGEDGAGEPCADDQRVVAFAFRGGSVFFTV